MTSINPGTAHPQAMAEMAGGALEAQSDALLDARSHGVDAAAVVAAELAAEGSSIPVAGPAVRDAAATGPAALHAETED